MARDTEVKITYGVWGLIAGAAITMVVGFNWGGWTTSSTTQKKSDDALLAYRASICVAQFMNAPNQAAKLKEFEAVKSFQRYEFIGKGGWDRMPGEKEALYGVSSACVAGVEALAKTGA